MNIKNFTMKYLLLGYLVFINSHISLCKKTITDYNSANVLMTNLDRRLQRAAREGKLKKVETLINRGANVNSQDGVNFSPLHLAVMYDKKEVVELLLKHNAQVNIKNDYDETPVIFAAENGNRYIIDLLLRYGADVTIQSTRGETVLHKASKHGNVENLKLLFEKGAGKYINKCSTSHLSPLHHAAIEGNEEAILALLNEGADPSNECNNDFIAASPVEIALVHKKFNAARLLKQHLKNREVKDIFNIRINIK